MDPVQNPNQQPVPNQPQPVSPVVPSQNVQQPVQVVSPVVDQPSPRIPSVQPQVPPIIPTESVGHIQKEAESVAAPEQFLTPSEQEPVLHPELQEIGVEVVKDVPELTLEDKKAGLGLAKESTPAITQPTGAVQLPLTEEEEKKMLQSTTVKDSPHWLATLIGIIRKKLQKTKTL